MILNETKAILKDIAILDNRKLDEAVALAWHAVVGHMSYEVAQAALVLARQDASINYLEPKHLVQWGKEAAHRLGRNKTASEAPTAPVAPEPLCRDHQLKIMSCNACCRLLSQKAASWNMFETPSKENGFSDYMFKGSAALHAWAKENIYA